MHELDPLATMAKLCQETNLSWTDILPLVLLWVHCVPRARVGFSPFEILYGRPPPLIRPKGDLKELGKRNSGATTRTKKDSP